MIDKLGYVKFKNFCSRRERKRSPTGWEKTSSIEIYGDGLHLESTGKSYKAMWWRGGRNEPMTSQKGTRGWPVNGAETANVLVSKEVRIKSTMIGHSATRERGRPWLCIGCFGKSFGNIHGRHTPVDLANPLPGTCNRNHTDVPPKSWTIVHCSFIRNNPKSETPKSLSMSEWVHKLWCIHTLEPWTTLRRSTSRRPSHSKDQARWCHSEWEKPGTRKVRSRQCWCGFEKTPWGGWLGGSLEGASGAAHRGYCLWKLILWVCL